MSNWSGYSYLVVEGGWDPQLKVTKAKSVHPAMFATPLSILGDWVSWPYSGIFFEGQF